MISTLIMGSPNTVFGRHRPDQTSGTRPAAALPAAPAAPPDEFADDQAQVEQSHRGRPSLLADHREHLGEMSKKIPRISSMCGCIRTSVGMEESIFLGIRMIVRGSVAVADCYSANDEGRQAPR